MGIHDTNPRDIKSHAPQNSSDGKNAAALRDNRPGFVAQGKFVSPATSQNYLVDNRVTQKKGNNTGLPNQLKTNIENISGHSLDDVKVHYNSNKPAQLQALAYAQGTDIHIAAGQEKHLPHEAWHVVQQKQGRVKPTTQLKGKVNINDNTGLEKEADVMSDKVRSMRLDVSSQYIKSKPGNIGSTHHNPVQRVKIVVEGWSKDEENTTDVDTIKSILESVRDGDFELSEQNKRDVFGEYEKGTYEEDEELVKLVETYCKTEDPDNDARIDHEIESEDANAWRSGIGASKADQLEFLVSVVAQTRRIIPIAINRIEEDPGSNQLIHNVFLCQQTLVKQFAGMMEGVDSNYIHPAILERIMLIVKQQVRELGGEQNIQMAGICKDYASIAYGLIRQNDPDDILQARLGFIKDHVFVLVNVKGEPYVVDAWRAPGDAANGVIPEDAHIAHLNRLKGTGNFRKLDNSATEKAIARDNPRKTKSLDDQYDNYKIVYQLFKNNERRMAAEALQFLRSNVDPYVVAGKY